MVSQITSHALLRPDPLWCCMWHAHRAFSSKLIARTFTKHLQKSLNKSEPYGPQVWGLDSCGMIYLGPLWPHFTDLVFRLNAGSHSSKQVKTCMAADQPSLLLADIVFPRTCGMRVHSHGLSQLQNLMMPSGQWSCSVKRKSSKVKKSSFQSWKVKEKSQKSRLFLDLSWLKATFFDFTWLSFLQMVMDEAMTFWNSTLSTQITMAQALPPMLKTSTQPSK